MPRRGHLLFCLLLWCLWVPRLVCAEPVVELMPTAAKLSLVGQADYWIDQDGKLAYDTVAERAHALPWQPVEAGARYPIDHQVLWMRFTVRYAPDTSAWFLVLPYSGLDRAVLYFQDAKGRWITQEAGDARPVSEWPMPGRFPTFPLAENTGTEPVTYFLRLEHARIGLSVTPRLQSRHSLATSRENEQLLQGAYFGLVVLMGMLALALALAWRDRVFALFALYVAAMGVAQMAHLGFGHSHVWSAFPAFNRTSTFVLAPLATMAGVWLIRAIAVPARSGRWLDTAAMGITWALPAAVVLDTLVQHSLTRELMSWLMLLAVMLIGVMLVAAWRRRDDRHIKLVALACLPMLLMVIAPLLSMVQLIPASGLTRYSTSVAALLQIPMLLYALAVRHGAQREALVRQEAMATTDPLTGLALEHVLLLRLDATLKRAWKESLDFALVALRVVNLEEIVATHGQRAGERAMVLASYGIKRFAREQDAVARVGEHDIALLMEAPVSPEHTRKSVERLLTSLQRQAEQLPAGVRPRIEVGYAVLPKDSLDARLVLDLLLGGLPTATKPPPAPIPHPTLRQATASHLLAR